MAIDSPCQKNRPENKEKRRVKNEMEQNEFFRAGFFITGVTFKNARPYREQGRAKDK